MELDRTMVLTGFGAMATVITALWAMVRSNMKQSERRSERTEAALDDCEKRHKETHVQILDLTRQLGEVKGKQDGINELAHAVLRTVAGSVKGKKNE